jgi:uncharacterized OB-fold protein
MVFCKRCGAELKEGDEFCSSCGSSVNLREIILATWGERFMAYLIDIILIGIVAGML